MKPKLYLAGPDVFRPDALTIGTQLRELCALNGCEGLYPIDGSGETPPAPVISETNETMIRIADAVIANISPFRGPNVDDGTAFEIGFARALRKPVFRYSSDRRTIAEKVRLWSAVNATRLRQDKTRDHNGDLIEDFGLTANLMITPSRDVMVFDTAAEAIEAAALHFGTR